MNDTSGPTSPKAFAEYDPDTSSWRTWPAIGLWGSTPYSGTWPRSGMTSGGRAYELPTSALRTVASACSSSPQLKTPTANLAINGGSQHPDKRKAGGHGPTLADQIEHELLPTPTAHDAKGTGPSQRDRHSMMLTEVSSLLPTPLATDGQGGPKRLRTDGRTETDHGPTIKDVVMSLLPTPRASDGEKGGPNQRGSSGDLMLPSAVVQLLPTPTATPYGSNQSLSPGAAVRPSLNSLFSGDSSSLPSDAGNESSDE